MKAGIDNRPGTVQVWLRLEEEVPRDDPLAEAFGQLLVLIPDSNEKLDPNEEPPSLEEFINDIFLNFPSETDIDVDHWFSEGDEAVNNQALLKEIRSQFFANGFRE